MPKKFKFTQKDLDAMILGALNEPIKPEEKTAKPNIVEKLLTKRQLMATKGKE